MCWILLQMSNNSKVCDRMISWEIFALPFMRESPIFWKQKMKPVIGQISLSRKSPWKVFLGKGVLKISNKFTREHPCRSVVSIKLLWNRSSTWVFFCKFAAYFQNTSGGQEQRVSKLLKKKQTSSVTLLCYLEKRYLFYCNYISG